jgi:hypothetical protein
MTLNIEEEYIRITNHVKYMENEKISLLINLIMELIAEILCLLCLI